MNKVFPKSQVLFAFLMLLSLSGISQIVTPVTWKFESKEVGPNQFELRFHASVDPGWHLYSQFIEEGGPVPTTFYFEEVESATVAEGKAKELGDVHRVQDKIFDMEVAYFSDKATFVQMVTTTGPKAKVVGYLEFMACDDEKCLPPSSEDFSFELISNLAAEPKEEQRQEPPQLEAPPAPKKEKPKKKQEQNTPSPKQNIPSPTPAPQSQVLGDNLQEQSQAPSPIATSPIFGQGGAGTPEPVKWSYTANKLSEDTYELRVQALIEPGWKIYSMHMEEGGPIPTGITFEPGEYELSGKLIESPKAKTEYDKEIFDMEVSTLGNEALYTQIITTDDPDLIIEGELNYMTCDDEVCQFPPPISFSIPLNGALEQTGIVSTTSNTASGFKILGLDIQNPISACIEAIKTSDDLWVTFLLGLVGGFIGLLTPCVFPMIPLTVSFFTKGSENKQKGIFNGVLYGLAILLIYVLFSVPFHFLESVSPEIFNVISTNPWVNLAFFAIFVVFAISFFGYFELSLPHTWTNKADSASNIGGILGIFFMALTLVLVSFSCTGPILGGLLGATSISPESGAMHLTAGMGGFGVGLGLPFALFAMFPGWLNSLPKSGGWLNTVKVVLGFIELALAIKFLSNADLVWQAGILKREIFFAIWILVCLGLAAYILGWIRFPHDSPRGKITAGQLGWAAVVLAFAAYLMPGLAKDDQIANRALVSGFPPPLYYSIYDKDTKCPLGIDCFKDYEEGMAYARKVNKPVMLDFTGHACQNCRRMEENVWVNKDVFKRISDEYVLISLYVDDRTKLPKEQQQEIDLGNGSKKKIRTIGNKWATFQVQNFQHSTQPYYVLMSPDEKLLNNPVAYTPEVDEYLNFLDCGLSAFQQTALK